MNNDFKIDNSLRGFCAKGCGRQDKQLNTYDYLADIPGNAEQTDLVVRAPLRLHSILPTPPTDFPYTSIWGGSHHRLFRK